MDNETPRARAGKVNALRRWNPAHDEVRAYDIEQVVMLAGRLPELTTDEASRVLDALGLDPAVICRKPGRS